MVLLEHDGLATRVAVTIAPDSPVGSGSGQVRVAGPDGQAAFAFAGRDADSAAGSGATGPVAPVPGTVVSVLVAPGDSVAQGDPLVVLEAMKMEHKIVAERDGIVGEVLVAPGQSVDAHQILVQLDSPDSPTQSDFPADSD